MSSVFTETAIKSDEQWECPVHGNISQSSIRFVLVNHNPVKYDYCFFCLCDFIAVNRGKIKEVKK